MNGTHESAGPKSLPRSNDGSAGARYALIGLFLFDITGLIAHALISSSIVFGQGAWAAGTLILGLAATWVSLSSQLPFQNVLLGSVIIGIIGGAIHSLGALTGIPFGPIVYTDHAGPQMFNTIPWFMPLLWIFAILNARGVARMILRPWRKLRVYGYWLIGLTVTLALLFDFELEPFATHSGHFWLWRPTKLHIDWCDTPLTNFLGWLVTTLLILAFATPSLMKKKPAKSPSHYDPLLVWTGVNVLFIASSIGIHFWPGTALGVITCALVIPFAIRGAKW